MDLLFVVNIDFKMLRRMEGVMFHFVISLITIATDCNQKQELGFNCWIKEDNEWGKDNLGGCEWERQNRRKSTLLTK